MNKVKFIKPETGELKLVPVISRMSQINANNGRRLKSVARTTRDMARQGFIRCGLRASK